MKKNLTKGILAGIMIAIGGTAYLSLENKLFASVLFAIGLFVILTNNLNLYTGKIGYLVTNSTSAYGKEVFTTLIGNFIGTFASACILKQTRLNIIAEAQSVSETKLNDSVTSIFILSLFCGLLMYLAVEGYKSNDNFAKYLGVFLCVSVFIICGFEHSIANMFYFTLANSWSLKAFAYLLIMILGNTIGGIFFPLTNKLINVNN